MRILRFDDFAGKAGAVYDVLVEGGVVPLTLQTAELLPGGPREGGAFRLVFVGAADQALPQGTFPIRSGGETGEADEIFIVPIAEDATGRQYEAIFF
jgi:hypothetical protein